MITYFRETRKIAVNVDFVKYVRNIARCKESFFYSVSCVRHYMYIFSSRYHDQLVALESKLPISEGHVSQSMSIQADHYLEWHSARN